MGIPWPHCSQPRQGGWDPSSLPFFTDSLPKTHIWHKHQWVPWKHLGSRKEWRGRWWKARGSSNYLSHTSAFWIIPFRKRCSLWKCSTIYKCKEIGERKPVDSSLSFKSYHPIWYYHYVWQPQEQAIFLPYSTCWVALGCLPRICVSPRQLSGSNFHTFSTSCFLYRGFYREST